MEGISIKEKYGYLFKELAEKSNALVTIDSDNVYQVANPKTREAFSVISKDFIHENSKFEGKENIHEFFRQIKSGKHGLILMEHYSNMDLPALVYMLEKECGDEGKQLAEEIVAIAGIKLNVENPIVEALTESFSRIVVYPTRSIAAISDPDEKALEEAKSRKINIAAMRAMDNVKKENRPILVFPAGTRYRPGKPETKKGVREIDTYLRIFDIMILISENGNVLRINPEKSDDMLEDLFCEDTLVLAASPIIECKKFRNGVLDTLENYEGDKKVVVVSKIMEILQNLHDEHTEEYKTLYKNTFGKETSVEQ